MTWQARAACRGYPTVWFYPSRTATSKVPEVFCAHCPVITDCRAEAAANREQFGIWGGRNALDRAEAKAGHRRERRLARNPGRDRAWAGELRRHLRDDHAVEARGHTWAEMDTRHTADHTTQQTHRHDPGTPEGSD